MGCINIVDSSGTMNQGTKENAQTSLRTTRMRSFECTRIAENMMHEQSMFLGSTALPFHRLYYFRRVVLTLPAGDWRSTNFDAVYISSDKHAFVDEDDIREKDVLRLQVDKKSFWVRLV